MCNSKDLIFTDKFRDLNIFYHTINQFIYLKQKTVDIVRSGSPYSVEIFQKFNKLRTGKSAELKKTHLYDPRTYKIQIYSAHTRCGVTQHCWQKLNLYPCNYANIAFLMQKRGTRCGPSRNSQSSRFVLALLIKTGITMYEK